MLYGDADIISVPPIPITRYNSSGIVPDIEHVKFHDTEYLVLTKLLITPEVNEPLAPVPPNVEKK